MPFGPEGSDLSRHFSGIFENIYARVATDCGFKQVERGDSQLESGDILEQVIKRLSEDELVIADLTGANPNVYYELGVRHSLLSNGTILCFDEKKTAEILRVDEQWSLPFNIRGYRTIRYSSDGTEILDFYTLLERAISSRRQSDKTDSPVHSAVKTLPPNVVAEKRDDLYQELRAEIDRLGAENRRYSELHGSFDSGVDDVQPNPFDLLRRVLDLAKTGNTPSAVLSDAESAVSEGNAENFLSAVLRLEEMSLMSPSVNDFTRLFTYSSVLGLGGSGLAILRVGRRHHPEDLELENLEIGEAAKSGTRSDRLAAKEALLEQVLGGERDQLRALGYTQLQLLNAVMDAFYARRESDDAVDTTTRLLESYCTDPIVLRNHARAKEQAAGFNASLFWYRCSVVLPDDAPDLNATWLGNSLHNRGGHYADALEAFALAALLDPDDSRTFSNVADEIALYMRESSTGAASRRSVSGDIANADIAQKAILLSVGAGDRRSWASDTRRFLDRAARNLGTDLEQILIAAQERDELIFDRQERFEFAQWLYEGLQSELTTTMEPAEGLPFPTDLTELEKKVLVMASN